MLHKAIQVRLYPIRAEGIRMLKVSQCDLGVSRQLLQAGEPVQRTASPSRATGEPVRADGDARSPLASPCGRRLANASLSAVSAVGGEVRPTMGRKSHLRQSPMSTEAQTSAVGKSG
ncbi:hypothetical protein [Nostoc sp. ChiQUE01b]|uniref:hypothetical protein n=1 Tax=Nostoc sp. ChiQUE01b TaxID=3075376 RepID=UPI002AD4DF9B|nr:hypothetical protein [Nostoc sp. ChiQUE01b]MDZ8259293.1 hypothetical protein [Nostoc sp. ChiQUE01b]